MLTPNDLLHARILIVDDQRANVQLLEQMLGGEGYQAVMSTTDPTAVCGLHREHRYDLILLDLQMPAMDGFAVLEALRLVEPESYVPVLVITAQAMHKVRALQSGAKDFVSKPFDLFEIKTRIQNLLEVRLLHRALADHNRRLEQAVLARTAELQASEARFRRYAELSSDWYWEQDAQGVFTHVGGPVLEMLGISDPGARHESGAEREPLMADIAARRPFLDFMYSRVGPDGHTQHFLVSGEPIFEACGRYAGYRGVGVDVSERVRILKLAGDQRD